jgi:hypothetical protein
VLTATDTLNTALAHRYRIERERGEGGMATIDPEDSGALSVAAGLFDLKADQVTRSHG